jgi:cell division protein FtsB
VTTPNKNLRNGNFGRNKRSEPRPLVHAYRQAPWRIQTQRGVLLLIVAVLGASVMWVMVSVTVQAATAGLEIQQLEDEQEYLQRQIAMLRTDIAFQTSSTQMQQRADKLGFQAVDPADITYMVVPGYKGREPEIQAPPPGSTLPQPLVKPAYTQSLWEWLLEGILALSEPVSPSGPARAPVGGSSP